MICGHCHHETEINPCSNCGSISKDYFHPYNKGDYIDTLSDKKALDVEINALIRDVTSVIPLPKSLVRRRINVLLSQSRLDTIQEVREKVENQTFTISSDSREIKGFEKCRNDVLSTLSEMEGKV